MASRSSHGHLVEWPLIMPRDPDAEAFVALVEAGAIAGWFPLGDLAMTCRNCGTQNQIVLTTEFTSYGTGPGGRHRLGDPSRNVAVCQACGARGYKRAVLAELRASLAFFTRRSP